MKVIIVFILAATFSANIFSQDFDPQKTFSTIVKLMERKGLSSQYHSESNFSVRHTSTYSKIRPTYNDGDPCYMTWEVEQNTINNNWKPEYPRNYKVIFEKSLFFGDLDIETIKINNGWANESITVFVNTIDKKEVVKLEVLRATGGSNPTGSVFYLNRFTPSFAQEKYAKMLLNNVKKMITYCEDQF